MRIAQPDVDVDPSMILEDEMLSHCPFMMTLESSR